MLKQKETEKFMLAGHEILPGESKTLRLDVGRLPSDTRIYISAHVFRSTKPGPCVLLLGGVHGDEINGVEIIRKSLEEEVFQSLKKGTIIAIPLLNIYGFINFSREVPDGKDVNRSFPGNSKGSLASRVARTLTKKILPIVDFAMDFHTGGASRFNYPQIRYSRTDKFAQKLAKDFAAPYTIQKPLITKSFRKVAMDMGKSVIVYEAGESVRLDGHAIQKGYEGMIRVLQGQKMLDGKLVKMDSTLIKKTSWLRASHAGMFTWTQCSGHHVTKGEQIGVIKDPQGSKSIIVRADRDGFVIGHNNASVVNEGDALFHIGYDYSTL